MLAGAAFRPSQIDDGKGWQMDIFARAAAAACDRGTIWLNRARMKPP